MQVVRLSACLQICVYSRIRGGRTPVGRPVAGLKAAALHGVNLQDHHHTYIQSSNEDVSCHAPGGGVAPSRSRAMAVLPSACGAAPARS